MVYLDISRKQLHSIKRTKDVQKKILNSTRKIKKGFALMGASVLVSTIAMPIQQVMAKDKDSANQPETKKYSDNPFLNSIIAPASSIAAKNDLYASVMLAQAVLESGWGQSGLAAAPNYNLFGIKGNYEGESVVKDTLEDNGNQEYYNIKAEFRKYPSYTESLEDYAQLLKNGTSWDSNFYSGAWKSNAKTYKDATSYLTGKYATDTAYNTKLNRIIEEHGLTAYDTPGSSTPPAQTDDKNTESNNTSGQTYTVKSGDTLYRIAANHDTSVVDLMTWNKLNSSNIYPGMKLVVGTTSTPQETVPGAGNTTPNQSGTANQTYQVKSGDTLWSISQKYNVTVAQIKSWNNLSNDMVQLGQTIKVSASAQTEKPAPETNTGNQTNNNLSVQSVKVVNGDNLYRIATKVGISVSELKAINGLTSDNIFPGQVLNTKKTSSVEEEPATETPVTTGKDYTVQKGDTLYRIALNAGVSVNQVKEWNKLSSDNIFIGQILKLSTNVQVEKPLANTNNQTSTATATTITVATGDTLYKLATKIGISVSELKAINGLTSDNIFPGQVLNTKKTTSVQGKPVTETNTNTQASTTTATTITVASGDTLYKLATKTGLAISELKAINGLSSDIIFPGQVLNTKKTTPVQEKPVEETNVINGKQYTVQKGDTLYQIATKAGVSVNQMKEWNQLSSDIIFVGQSLQIGSAAIVVEKEAPVQINTYQVQKGDTLYSIAKDNGVSLTQLMEWNNVNSTTIYPGQALKVK